MSFYRLDDKEQAIIYFIFNYGGVNGWQKDLLQDLRNLKNFSGWETIAPEIINYIKVRSLDVRIVNKLETDIEKERPQIVFPLDFKGQGANAAITAAATGNFNTPTAADVFEAVVKFCVNKQLYWDDCNKNLTVYEVNAFYDTTFGHIVTNLNGFTSQPEPWEDSTTTSTTTNTQAAPKTRAPKTANPNGPVKDYKSLGPLATKCRDVKDTTVIVINRPMYKISGVKGTNKSEVNAYIKPVLVGDYGRGGDSSSTNKLLFGSAKGYGYCTCLWSSVSDADAALKYLQDNNRIPSDVTNVQVCSTNNQHRFIKIGTETGDCYISAGKINEALGEEFEEDLNTEEVYDKYSEISPEFFEEVLKD